MKTRAQERRVGGKKAWGTERKKTERRRRGDRKRLSAREKTNEREAEETDEKRV